LEAITRFGDKEIRRRAEADPALADVLERTLSALEVLLAASQRAYRLRAVLTREGEYLIRMEVAYCSRQERDALWDQAAAALEQVRAGRNVDILCGIYRLRLQG